MSIKGPDAARDFFLYLLKMGMLYVGIVSFLMLIFQYVNITWPDVFDPSHAHALEIVRNAMADLIVVWPVYLFLAFFIRRDMINHPDKIDLWVRKRLLYLTLFVSAVTMIVDLITLVNYFLDGELTLRFVLKVLAVLLVVGLVFAYYLWDLRKDGAPKSKMPKWAAATSAFVVCVTIVGGFFIAGTPSEQRQVRLDEERVNDLTDIQNEVINYWVQKRELPETLTGLDSDLTGFHAPKDPSSENDYEYSVKDDYLFELCATFGTDNQAEMNYKERNFYSSPWGQENWIHKAERTCFERKIDPDLYSVETPLKTLDIIN